MRIKESSKKTLYLVLGLLLLSICSLTIVYAALSAVLRISGNSEVVASNWDIHLANPEVKSGSVHNNLPTIDDNKLSFNATLSLPGDFYEFTVDVVNDGSIDAMIDSVVKTPELTSEQAKYIKYEITYENGEGISTSQTIKSGTSTPIKVRVEYRQDLIASDLPSSETNLNLKLMLIYVQSDGSGSSIPNNGSASVVNVVSGDGSQVGDEVCIDTECFYVISSTDTTVTMLAKYNLLVGNIMVDDGYTVEPRPMSKPTGIQDKTADGDEIGITDFSNYWWNTVSSYPAYVYGSDSTLYNYVENYKTYLSTLGVTLNEARLITKDELIGLGCSEDDYSCSAAPSWVYATSYWSGTADNTYYVWYVESDTHFSYYWGSDYDGYFGVRPVITISRDYL